MKSNKKIILKFFEIIGFVLNGKIIFWIIIRTWLI
jgi:hypothetical protein